MYTVTQPESFKCSAIHNFVWRTNNTVICRIVFIYKTSVGLEVCPLNLSISFLGMILYDTTEIHLNVSIWALIFFGLCYKEVNTVHNPAGKRHRLEIHSLCTRGGCCIIPQAGMPREQVSSTAVETQARLRTWWRTMCWWMWRDFLHSVNCGTI